MVNWRLIVKILGILLQIEAGLMILCQIVAFIYGEVVKAFSLPILLAVVLGCIGMFLGNKAGKTMGRKDGYIVVSVTWVVFTLIGIFGIHHFFKTRYKYKIRERLLANIDVYDSIVLWLLLLIFPQHYSSVIGGLAVSLSPLLYKRSTTWKVS